MGFIRNYDVLNEQPDVRDILLLHPSMIEEELAKIEEKSPFYIVNIDGKDVSVFLPDVGIKDFSYIDNMMDYIPKGTLIPIGGVDGRFSLKILRENGDNLSSFLGKRTGYYIIDRESGRQVVHVRKNSGI